MTAIVRPARAEDAPALRAILHDTLASTWLPQLTPEAARKQAGQDKPAAFVAEHVGKMAADADLSKFVL